MVYDTGKTSRWQTDDRGQSGYGEPRGSAILLYFWDALSLGGSCELVSTIVCHVEWGTFNELLLLQRKSLELVRQEHHAPCNPPFPTPPPNPPPDLTCIACNAMTELAGCVVSWSSTKSARKISWRGCSLMIWNRHSATTDSDGTTMQNVVMDGWRMSGNSIPHELVAVSALRKPGQKWSTWTVKRWL